MDPSWCSFFFSDKCPRNIPKPPPLPDGQQPASFFFIRLFHMWPRPRNPPREKTAPETGQERKLQLYSFQGALERARD